MTATHLEPGPAGPIEDLHHLVEQAAASWREKVGLVFPREGVELTFGQINGSANLFAAELGRRGVGAGDSVALLLRNRPEFAGAWLAAAKLGARVVPINTRFTQPEVEYVVQHSGAVLVISEPDHAEVLAGVSVPIMDCRSVPIPSPEDLACRTTVRHSVHPDTTLNIQYTSGTTARPKGCLLPHGYWTRIAEELTRPDPDGDTTVTIQHDDRFLTAQPMHYMDPQWHLATALMSGATLVVLDGFHPSSFWRELRKHQITIFYCLGAMPTLLLKMPTTPEERHHQVRAILCSAIPPQLHEVLEQRWGVRWYELYGMTETGVDIRMRASEHDALLGSACIGRPAADRDVAILGVTGEQLPADTVGELAIRGRWTMSGYFRDEEATARTLVDDWVRTGDIARMDGEGRVYFVGREKHMIRRAGENISAAQVETTLVAHPAVIEAACVPVPDELRGEEVLAFLRLQDTSLPSPDIFAEHTAERLAGFKVPRYWVFVDEFPRTASERVERRHLVATLNDGSDVYDRIERTWRDSPFPDHRDSEPDPPARQGEV
ncbi:AMP-binding protein [Aeromicrobium sp. CF4.19]|uniref:AMP-binding protein n=1 Tax=Aeromicrobium sp. CF4.19 TaxID=3373082 RepID=UPI003EE5C944